ncbi:hypothetical protein SAMN02800694_2617 [Luteibacter sp. UNCMF331Sha3.1]|nr:hypothetical protein SAMN02800694_2617 [Luteibacter sp. UNCMF331Sha3.1]
MQEFVSLTDFMCPACGAATSGFVPVPEPDWGAMESLSDMAFEGDSDVACSACAAVFDCHVDVSGNEVTVTLDKHPDVVVDAGDPMFWPPDDDWLNDNVPESPWGVFDASIGRVRQMCAVAARESDADTRAMLLQMLFSQLFSVLEAFLCDTLIKHVSEHADSLRRLVQTDQELRSVTVSLDDVLGSVTLVLDHVRGFLQKVIYHNLARVNRLYTCALGQSIWPDTATKDALHRAVQARNHMVHRNGRDMEGRPLVVGVEEVEVLMNHIVALADTVERLVSDF